MTKIRICPFCGGDKAYLIGWEGESRRVVCSCGASGPWMDDDERAVAWWNGDTHDKAQEAADREMWERRLKAARERSDAMLERWRKKLDSMTDVEAQEWLERGGRDDGI